MTVAVDGGTAAQLVADSGLPATDARALLAHQLRVTREHLIAHPDKRVTDADARRFTELAQRRRSGEPLAYLLGEREFYGRTFAVTPAVLVPRPETELLVHTALHRCTGDVARVLDLGTGSGCIAITLALERPNWHLVATDASPPALELARINAQRLQARNIAFHEGNWFAALADEDLFDLIVANPPYVAPGDSHLDALTYEPQLALVSGDGGLGCLRTIINGAPRHLRPGGLLALEHGYEQAEHVRAIFAASGWRQIQTLVDLAGHLRVTMARTAGDVRGATLDENHGAIR